MSKYKNLVYLLTLLLIGGCSGQQEKFFNDIPTIHFDIEGNQKDSITLSFAKITAKEMIYELPVEIAGYKTDYDRNFIVVVDGELTTAKPDMHYKILDTKYTLPAGEFRTTVPVVVYCKDVELDDKAVELYLKIESTDDFKNGMADRQTVKFSISNILLKPAIWEGWWKRYFGPYSKTKHKIIMEICDVDEIPDKNDGERHRWKGYGLTTLGYFTENYPVYDEDGIVIEPNWTVTY